MLGIIVLLEGPMMPKLQLPHWRHDIFSQYFLIVDRIHLARCRFPVPEDPPEHHWATAMLRCRQGVLFSICFILHSPDIPQFCFIAPQNRIPKPLWLIYIVLSKLELTFLVLLGQEWFMSWSLGMEPFKRLVCALLWKLKPQCLLPSSLTAGLLQSVEGFWPPVS